MKKTAAKIKGRAVRPTTSGKPTLRTISEISGLAVATVSRALNDAPDLKEDTKRLVRQIAKEIGYVPNRAGLGLRTGRTNVISLILSTENDMMNHTAQLMSSIAAGLRGSPFHLTITPFFPDQDIMEPVRYVVETASADAIILNRTQLSDPRIDYLIEKNFPFATHGRSGRSDEHPYFDYDNVACAQIAVKKLARKGCRSIVIIGPPINQTYAQHMRDGALEEAEKLGISCRLEARVNSDQPGRVIQSCVEHILKTDKEVDGFIAASAPSTMAVVAGIEATGHKIGQDINLATKEPGNFISLFRKNIIVLSEDVPRAGHFLAKAAIQAIKSPTEPPLQELEVPQDDGL